MFDTVTFTMIGRVERDPTIRPTARGSVTNLFIKTIEQLNADGSIRVRAQSFPVTVFAANLQEKVIPQLQIGNIVSISGKVDRRSYQPQGAERASWSNDLVANSILIIGGVTSQVSVSASEGDDHDNGNYHGGDLRQHSNEIAVPSYNTTIDEQPSDEIPF